MKRTYTIQCKICLATVTAKTILETERIFTEHLLERHTYKELLECASDKAGTITETDDSHE